jgi:hypothetical protein
MQGSTENRGKWGKEEEVGAHGGVLQGWRKQRLGLKERETGKGK